jgi:chromosome segregation ATPase
MRSGKVRVCCDGTRGDARARERERRLTNRARVGLEELKRRKRSVESAIEAKERDGDALRRRLKDLEGLIARDRETLVEYDKIIRDAEQSLDRILESSEFLLNAIRRETQNLDAREP